MEILLAEAPFLDDADIALILTYDESGPAAASDDEIHRALRRLVPDREKQIMTRFGRKHFEEGLQQGRTEGRTEGEASALTRVLEKRFGGVPSRVQEHILSADLASIQTWLERVIEAPDLQSVFGPG